MDWLRLVRAEYLEMPDLQLTRPEIQRLWGLDAADCDAILNTLLAEQFLHLTAAGRYVLAGTHGLHTIGFHARAAH